MMFSTPLTDHISASGDTRSAKIKVEASHSASFNVYVDWVKLVIGSTNDGSQQNNVSVGTPSGNLSDAGNVDTTAASPAVWTLTSSNTYTNQYSGDTNSTYSVAADFSVPITEPSSANITGVHLASRTNNSSATPITPVGIWNRSGGWSDFQTRVAGTAYVQHPYMVSGNVYRYPVWGSTGTATAPTATSDVAFGASPQDYHDSTNNLSGFKIRTTTGLTSSFTVAVDFAFLSIRYVAAEVQFTTQWTPDSGTKNTGGAETNTWRFTKQADGTATPWTIANSGAGVGVDVQLEFQGVTLPSGYNRLIINSKYAWSVANATHNMQIYDFTAGTWRNLASHGQALTDYMLVAHNTASTYQFYQYEIFNGYFRDASASPGAGIDTPLTNFVGTGADLGKVRIKYVRGTTTGNLSIDWAQLEVALDNTYYVGSSSLVAGTSQNSRFYADTYYPDNTTGAGTGVSNYSYGVTKAGSGTDRIDLQLNFKNVTVPYDGANAVLIDYSAATSVANEPVTLQIWNYTAGGGSWESLNAGNLQGGTANRYERWQFIKPIDSWANYINTSAPNEVRLRVWTTDTTALNYFLDYARITLGSVTTAGDSSEVSWGTSLLNDKTYTANLDSTLLPSLTANWNKGWYVNSSGAGRKTLNGLAGVGANINFPATRPASSLITGIRWAMRAQSGASTVTIAPFIRDKATYYATPTNAQYLNWFGAAAASSNLGYAPAAADVLTLGTTAQAFASGLYQISPEDTLDTTANKLNMAIRTTASTSLLEQTAIWDMAFVSLRYVVY
jgi:hypothetical protein